MRGSRRPSLTGYLARVGLMTSLCLGGLIAFTANAGAAPPHAGAGAGYTCSGGSPVAPSMIPAGSYGPVTVTGFCVMQGTYNIKGGLTVAPGAFLDAAVFFPFPPYDNYGIPCNVFVTVSGGIQVGEGSALYFGNGSDTANCPSSNDRVNGGLTATGAESVVVHGTTINGGVNVTGGGGGTSCVPTTLSPFAPYTDVEQSSVAGGISVSGLSTCWLGLIGNQVNGLISVNNNLMGDPDAIEIGLNVVHGAMACSGNALAFPGPGGVPTNSFDGSPPNPNMVTGRESGQCAGL